VVAQELVAADAALEDVADLGDEGLLGDGVLAIVPCVLDEHGKEGYHEECRVYVGNEIGFRVRVVGEDGLMSVVSFPSHCLLAIQGLNVCSICEEHTLAKKFEVVHRNTVASNSSIPIACLQRPRGFLPSVHTLTTLAGDRIGLSRSLLYLPGASSLFRGEKASAKGGDGGAMV
jgi:hypothetical protein